jgi:hypothetical protein
MLQKLLCAYMVAMCCISGLQANEEIQKKTTTTETCPNDKCVAEELLACKDCN